MELEFSSQHNEVNVSGQQGRCNNSSGIRIIGNRIDDSTKGITCHQCRQKTMKFAALCKNLKKGKPCVIKFCQKCLLNRYGEEAQEVELSSDWTCPKCRGICNCSCCMKKRGQQPTGALARTAKASGFKSVSEMLEAKASENLELNEVNDAAVLPTNKATLEKEQNLNCVDNLSSDKVLMSKTFSPIKPIASEKELVVDLSGEPGKENSLDGNSGLKLDSLKVQKTSPEKSKKTKSKGLKEISSSNSIDDAGQNKSLKKPKISSSDIREKETKRKANDGTEVCKGTVAKTLEVLKCTVNSEREKIEEEIPLPPGTELTEIFDIGFPPEDVGNALQFLEFCRVFGKAIDVKKGEAEDILRELIRKQNLRRGQNTLLIQFQLRLLTLILSDSGNEYPSLTTSNGNNSWLKALKDIITQSDLVLKEFPLDWLNEGIDGYCDLDLSKKLSLLNFICDEALNTEKLRSHMNDQNVKFVEDKKEAKSKVAAAKEKEKCLKQKLQDEMTKAVMSDGSPLSMPEHNALLSKIKSEAASKIKSEAAQTHTEVLEAMGTVPKRKQSCDAMRTEPQFFDSSGQAFWKLESFNGEYAVLMQDIKIQNAAATATDERWFVYGPEKKDEIDKYISSRAKRSKVRKVPYILSNESSEANM